MPRLTVKRKKKTGFGCKSSPIPEPSLPEPQIGGNFLVSIESLSKSLKEIHISSSDCSPECFSVIEKTEEIRKKWHTNSTKSLMFMLWA